jgi:hypothetical protein
MTTPLGNFIAAEKVLAFSLKSKILRVSYIHFHGHKKISSGTVKSAFGFSLVEWENCEEALHFLCLPASA